MNPRVLIGFQIIFNKFDFNFYKDVIIAFSGAPVVHLQATTLLVLCCDFHCDFRVQAMFSSSFLLGFHVL